MCLEQDRMLAMMGMRQGPKLENDCDSLVGDGELIDMSAHEKTQDSTQASDEEHHDAGFVENDDSELVEELPTQVKVWEGFMSFIDMNLQQIFCMQLYGGCFTLLWCRLDLIITLSIIIFTMRN